MRKYCTAQRLKQIMSERRLKQIDILNAAKPYCKKYSIPLGKSSLNQYISGYAEPGQKKLFILSLALNVSETWLMGYDVPMEKESPQVAISLSEAEQALLALFREVPTESQQIVIQMIRAALGKT